MKRFLTLAIVSIVVLSSCSSTKTTQNTPSKESVDNDLYFTNVKIAEHQVYASSSSQSQGEVNDGPLTRYYDPNDPDYYYANRINKFYYPNSYDAYYDDFYNPYHPYSSLYFGVGTYWGNPYYNSAYFWNRPYYWGMPSSYYSMSFGWGYPSYGYGYCSPYQYNSYLGYYYNNPWYSGGYYPGYYVYNVAPNNVYNNYGPRAAGGGTNINRPRTYRGNDSFAPRPGGELGTSSTRPAWRPDNSSGRREVGDSDARPRQRTYDQGSNSRENSRPTYTTPRSNEGSRSTGGESRSNGGSSNSNARPRSRN